MNLPSFNLKQEFLISDTPIGENAPCFVIAEAGVSHFGDFQKAIQLVDMAVEAKADAVKFQIFNVDRMISEAANDWKERLADRTLPYDDFARLKEYCDSKRILFTATAHEEQSLEYLHELDVPFYKIGSGEKNNVPYLREVGAQGKPVIYSTGMHEIADIRTGLAALTEAGNREIALLHCVTAYPTPPEQVNLGAMHDIRKTFEAVTGYSDHTEGTDIPLAAIAMGAKVIEKHITLEYNIPNAQDWKVSCGPENLKSFVATIRKIEQAMGSGKKSISTTENQSIAWATKSLVACRDLPAGHVLQKEDLIAKRPGTGISPTHLQNVIGKKLSAALKADGILTEAMLS